MSSRRVIVAGGGMGGLTVAIALRGSGIDAQVYERMPVLRDIGAGLHMWTNAVRVLQGLGVAEALERRSSVMQAADFRTASGRLIASWPQAEIGAENNAPTLMVSREELSRVLRGFVDESAIHAGKRLTGFEETPDGVEARFEDGTSAHGDVLVGADGLRSAVRAQLLADGPAREAGYTVWRGVLAGASRFVAPGTFCSAWGRGRRFVFYELGLDHLYWMSVAPSADAGELRGEPLKQALIERHAGWMAPIGEILAATDPAEIHRTPIEDRPPVDSWSSRRVTLLGDAAHPMTFNVGQGACQAIEDAAVLARKLAGADDIAAALRAYEEERKPRTTHYQTLAARLGALGQWSNPAAVALRNTMMRITYRTVGLKSHRADMAFTP